MKKYILSILFMLFPMGMAYADSLGNYGVPDPATILSLLGIGAAGVVAYSVFGRGKRK